MPSDESIFDQTYRHYLDQIQTLDLKTIAPKLGAHLHKQCWAVPLLGRTYQISPEGFFNSAGKRPAFEVCVILAKHLLMFPEVPPATGQWSHYRDMKDAGPLTVYWANNVEGAIVKRFQGSAQRLENAAATLGGVPPAEPLAYDVDLIIPALPRIPVRLLFNEAEEEFPGNCLVLLRKSAEVYLDAESLAVLGALVYRRLIAAG